MTQQERIDALQSLVFDLADQHKKTVQELDRVMSDMMAEEDRKEG